MKKKEPSPADGQPYIFEELRPKPYVPVYTPPWERKYPPGQVRHQFGSKEERDAWKAPRAASLAREAATKKK